MEPPVTNPTVEPTPVPAPPAPTKSHRRSGSDQLAILWYPGQMHLAVFRRQTIAGVWSSSRDVVTPAEFAAALDEGLAAISFDGTETTLVLEHAVFRHQVESGPLLNNQAAEALLRNRVERLLQGADPTLWVSQPLAATKTESSHLLHLLPSAFYRDLNGALLSRQLDLTRIFPLPLALAEMRPAQPQGSSLPMLLVAELGSNVCIQGLDADGRVLLSRVLQADWEVDSERIGVEANRCALFIKQRFGTPVGHVRLMGRSIESTTAELTKRCPSDATVTVTPMPLNDWLQGVLRIPPRHPANLLVRYLARKRSLRLWRQSILAAAWLGLSALALSSYSLNQTAADEASHYDQLRRDESHLQAEKERLLARNAELERHVATVRTISGDTLPAVPPRFLQVITAAAPATISLTDAQIRLDSASDGWTFRLGGSVLGDEFGCLETINTWVAALEKSPLRIRIPDANRNLAPAALADGSGAYRFVLEGVLLEH